MVKSTTMRSTYIGRPGSRNTASSESPTRTTTGRSTAGSESLAEALCSIMSMTAAAAQAGRGRSASGPIRAAENGAVLQPKPVAANQVHNAPAVLKPWSGDRKRQAQRQWRGGRGQPETKPDAEHRAQRRKKKDERSITRSALPRCHLVDVGVDDREVGADTDTGNRAR